jgi:dolichol-phosphate mannosyltransferase
MNYISYISGEKIELEMDLFITTPHYLNNNPIITMNHPKAFDINNINSMTDLAITKSFDLVISSRFKKEQKVALTHKREQMSLLGTKLIDLILKRQLTDPLSGCFLIKKDKYIKLHQELFLSGFKILFDILSSKSGRSLKVSEIPIKFLKRHSGESKLRKIILIQFIWTFILRYIERYIPLTFIIFCLIGSLGYLLHFLILSYFLDKTFFPYFIAQLITSYIVMLNNFWLNNGKTIRIIRIFSIFLQKKHEYAIIITCFSNQKKVYIFEDSKK